MSRVTVVRATPFDGEAEAGAWLTQMRREPEARDSFAADALRLLNRGIHTHRAATMDPYVTELGPHAPSATRVGYGEGEALAAGQWAEAVDAPADPGRRERRVEALRPQERLASVLGGRESVEACETLVLRARLDLDHGRPREAALQLEIAVPALVAEIAPGAVADQREDLELLRDQSGTLSKLREQALAGDLTAEAAGTIADTLAVAERILRRRRILGAS